MTDYTELHQRLAQAIIKAEGKIGNDTQAFVQRFIAQLKVEGYQVKGEAQAELTRYLDSLSGALTTAIKQAVVIGSALPMTRSSLQSKAVLAATERAFNQTWQNGANLSKRLWHFQQDSKTGLTELLQTGVKQGQASSKVVYDMQRLIERTSGDRFTIVSNNKAQWVKRLADAGKGLINNPQDRAIWLNVIADTERIIDKLATTGTRTDAERLLTDIKTAVNNGNLAAIDRAVEWKLYHKQLYNLKRLVRTEIATAMHNAVIDSTSEDSTIIGYQWRLSGSHKVFDICDYYANIDMGLGKGVFTKEAVPRHKAHPHCLCLIIPRVTPIKAKGSENYAQFLERLPPDKQAVIMPKWVQNLHGLGLPLQRVIRADGLGLMTQAELKAQMGDDKFMAAEALGKVISQPEWGKIDPTAHKSKARRTIADLLPHQSNSEVAKVIGKLQTGQSIDSLDYHYLYRRFVDSEAFTSKEAYAQHLGRIVRNGDNKIFLQQSGQFKRYAVYDANSRWAAVIDGQSGKWATGFKLHDGIEPEKLGDYLWQVKDIIS